MKYQRKKLLQATIVYGGQGCQHGGAGEAFCPGPHTIRGPQLSQIFTVIKTSLQNKLNGAPF